MRPRLAAWLFALTCAGCGPGGRPAGYVPDDAQQAQVEADIALAGGAAAVPAATASAAAAAVAVPAGEGGISPIPAFHGGDRHWRIEIQSVGDLRHDVTLRQGRARMPGTLTYRPLPGIGEDGPFDLDGALYAPQGDAPMHVHLEHASCLDAAGAHAWKVQVYVEGQAPRDGCGDVEM
ncbi:MAG TPA: hypothetical protein VLM17_04495 [Xanthomonadaceae bacterium]|nr:hypothetical protein [Xanthomonadaceae bacterium]